MISKSIRLVLLFLALLLATTGISILTFRLRALDSATYKRSLAPSGIYKEIRLSIEDQFIIDTIGEEALETSFAEYIVSLIDFPTITVEAAEENVDRLFDWINGKNNELRIYIPDQLIDKEIQELDLSMITFDQIARYSRELPVCTDETIEKNKIFPICREELTAPGQQLIQNQITSYLDTLQSSNYNNNKVFSTILNYPDLTSEVYFLQILDAQQEETRDSLLSSIMALKDAATSSLILGICLIVAAISILVLTIFLGSFNIRNALSTFAGFFIVTGVVVFAIGFLGSNSPQLIINLFLPDILQQSALSTEMSAAIALFLKRLFELLFEMMLYSGGAVILVSSLLYITAKAIPKTESEKRISETIGSSLPEIDIAPKLGR
ncbi:MAG: hypothetical protein QY330_04715 [Candidatus Dojkabacteria bacterium]|uniref:Uncharacterized protein n=1 Tax=Candidatus Dojkabacteria bacterium TaxID=2099670 RepID=A0A952AIS8_9BACT|nr:hypothetical protein [Candidatus Dojkabacteria bacterium]WKZ27818.1 MAG: hypothetical protein QY330_04715 [Candidatus Dojkabacteria bacterium]